MLNKHDYRYKNYLKLEKRMNEVWEKLNSIPWIPLDKPYKDGWYIFWDLRKDIAARKDAPLIREVVSVGYERLFTRNEAHVRAIRAGKDSVKGKKGKPTNLRPKKKWLTKKQYDSLSDNVKKYFELDELSERFRKYKIKEWKVQIPEYWIVLRVKGRTVTHYQKKGGQLESEYQFLRDQYYNCMEFGTNYGKSYPVHKGRAQARAAIARFKNGEADDIQIERIPMEYVY